MNDNVINSLNEINALLDREGYEIVGFDGMEFEDGGVRLSIDIDLGEEQQNQYQLK